MAIPVATEPFWESSGVVKLVPSDRNDSFVEAALKLLENASERACLGTAARAFYEQHFGMEHVIEVLRSGAAAGATSRAISQ